MLILKTIVSSWVGIELWKIVNDFEFKIEFKLSEAPIAHKSTLYGKPYTEHKYNFS